MKKKETPLSNAIKSNSYRFVHWLIEQCVIIDNSSKGALYTAWAYQCSDKLIIDLLQNGAVVETQFVSEEFFKKFQLLKPYIQDVNKLKTQNYNPLILACTDANMLSEMIKMGANVNNVDKNGEMALMYAIRNNNSQLVDILINAGADICHQNKNGEMAYQLLLNNSSLVNNISLSSLKRFLDNGVDVNRQNDEKNMLLHCLFFNMRPDMVSVIQLF